ncbi:uncharacterized protein LOC112904731 [Agrilus planipennis]|uniref:Uncharacterized protein LOC112904731 n=1 Tax=Agrilus planipennis TaxID=224129 RepID=A0A7F5R0W8_AGRPL|nr:uncharacterized protein LOC112904731 [Agrilus planipennis]
MGTEKITSTQKYEMIAPDGGYAHMVNVAAMLMLTFSVVPVSSFALIFGPFVSQFHDETSSVTIVTSVYVTLLNLTGLLANFLLQKLSYRKVGLIGAVLYVIGSLASIFVTDLTFLTISYGLLQESVMDLQMRWLFYLEPVINNIKILDCTVLKDAWYWNISIGLAVSFISETNFMAIFPVSLTQMGLASSQVTLMMTIYFISDLISRVIFSVVTLIWSFSVRLVFLINIILTIIFRLVFMFELPFWFLTILTGILGISRCLIQVLVVMVIAEEYSNVFTSAFSFYMVFNGILSILVGALMGSMTHHSHVLYIQTSILVLCAVPWTCQYIYNYRKTGRITHNHNKAF